MQALSRPMLLDLFVNYCLIFAVEAASCGPRKYSELRSGIDLLPRTLLDGSSFHNIFFVMSLQDV